ncbi:alpha/beta hydrolase [Piscinibacter sp. XHJ-5]|uniref:RBBP9/YdeN family alpha/beta hydrolase n=1 Tax=Piscinibacter sp. XHJ-5 TaxID=3037797 RepID=UPI002453326E|nr:alpha/beta hydrolase [Piscinibacter sp. XHJ-5]
MTNAFPRSWRVLLLPGWLDSLPAHWQSRWQTLHGFDKVEQDDWRWPRRGDWMARLDEVLLADHRPPLLVAHSLGCQLVASWAAHSRQAERVGGALLVAPPDTERADMPPQLFNWRPVTREQLPFASIAVISSNDPYCANERGRAMATAWGSEIIDIGARGHINGESGLGDWPEGLALLRRIAERAKR